MQKEFRHYHLTAELASKHSHTTYLVSTADEPNRQLVLTVFASWLFHFAHESEKLLQKAQSIKALQHPHLVPILDMGIEEEQPFVVREYLPHGSLRNHIKQIAPNRLELADALTIVSQIGEALAYAHEHNVVHSNIKPENILFDANGQAVLTDFYLVTKKDILIRDQISEEYAFCYLAPEQFANVSDAKSDQYALGCLTYELLTGQVPFAAQTLASLMGHQNYTLPTPLSEMGVDLPPSLEAAIHKTLAKDPAERFLDFSLFLEVIKSTMLPSPNLPLLRSNYVRKNRVPTHSVLSANAEIPIHKHINNSSKFFASLCETEDNKKEAADALPIAEASEPKQTSDISDSQLLASVLQSQLFVSSLSQHTVLNIREKDSSYQSLEEQKHDDEQSSAVMLETKPQLDLPTFELAMAEPETHDVWLSDPFKEEDTDASLVMVSLPGHEQSKSKATQTNSSLPNSISVDKSSIGRILRDRRRRLGLVLLLSAVLALMTYALWPSGLFTPNTNTHMTYPSHRLSTQPTANPTSASILAHSETPTTIATPKPPKSTMVVTPNPIVTPTVTPTPSPAVTPTATPTNTNISYPPYSGGGDGGHWRSR